MNSISHCKACDCEIELTKRVNKLSYWKRQYCDECGAEKRLGGKKSVSLETKQSLFAKRSNWQSARTALRKNAEATYNKSNLPKYCTICGYDKHFDVAHRKSVSEFSESTLVSEINSILNLVALCRNHHWEYDHQLMSDEDLQKILIT